MSYQLMRDQFPTARTITLLMKDHHSTYNASHIESL